MRALLTWGAVLIACACALLVAASEAGACSCAGPSPEADGERPALAAGGRAFIGTVVAKERKRKVSFPRTFTYRVRVERSFNVKLGRTLHLTSSADDGTCGFEWRKGQRVAGYLYGARGRWDTNSCSLASARDLLRDSRPYPRPARRGRVAMLAYGGFSGASVLALDRGGRILGYGFGPGPGFDYGPYAASVCPGSGAAVETGVDREGRPRLVTRDLATFRQTTTRGAEAFAVRCMNPSGSDVVVAAGNLFSQEGPARYSLVRRRGNGRLLLRRGRASALAFSPRFAFTIEGPGSQRLVATDLGNGRSRLIARFSRGADGLAVSPDGTRLAVRVNGFPEAPRRVAQLAVIDLNRSRPRVYRRRLESPFASGELIWAGSRRLLRVPYAGRIKAYSGRLRPLGRVGRARGGPATLLGDRLLEIDRGVLRSISIRGRAGHRVRNLPTANASLLLAVPGEPSMTAGPGRPSPRRPKVRSACRPSTDRR